VTKRCIARGLAHLYPAAWRAEYGQELTDLLLSRPLGVRALLNVSLSAVRQQLRSGEPWVVVGFPLALWTLAALLVGAFRFVRFESVPGAAWMQAAIFLGAGAWTVFRRGAGAGRAVIELNLLATSPLLAVGLLSALGLLHVSVFGPGDALPHDVEGGFAITFFDPSGRLGTAGIHRILLLFPILQIPYAGLLGWLGGLLGRTCLRLRRRTGHV
jgi:hypothetical protein